MSFSRTAPADLRLSQEQATQLRTFAGGLRENPQFIPIKDADRAWWGTKGVDVPTGDLDRKRLFELGCDLEDDDALLRFTFHVLAWGSGSSRRHNAVRVASLKDPGARSRFGEGTNRETLRKAFRAAGASADAPTSSWPRKARIRDAYCTLIRPGGGVIAGLGPAFFTKLLYFAGNSESPSCLILDARVAKSLDRLGWQMSPRHGSFSYNWYTDTYVSYCELLHQWATRDLGREVRADEIEQWLFEGCPAGEGQTS